MKHDIRHMVDVDATSMHVMSVELHTAGHPDDSANALRYVGAAYADEPLFVIRGRDALAFNALTDYAESCSRHGLYDMAEQVYEHARRFAEWQAKHAKMTRLPDPFPGWPDTQASDGVSEGASPFSRFTSVPGPDGDAPDAPASCPADECEVSRMHGFGMTLAEVASAVAYACRHGWPTDLNEPPLSDGPDRRN